MSVLFKQVKNNAKSTVTGLNNTTDPVTFTVVAGQGNRFPVIDVVIPVYFWGTVWDSVSFGDPGDDPNMEIILVTARSTDSLTASRGQLGTVAVSHTDGSAIRLLIVDQQVLDIQSAINAVETFVFFTG